ncbi:TPA: hypothetical protein DIC39_03685 [Patescibacteria group bacterium]|nr:hypothetical protein [Patescibacteria group bacterium]HCU48124.1 hypothetical protein [Patescibacteria group bacterium]
MTAHQPTSQHRFIFVLTVVVIFIIAIITIALNFRRIDDKTQPPASSLFDNIINRLKNSVTNE